MGRQRAARWGNRADGGGRKRGLQTQLETEIAAEIETFVGPGAVADLDFRTLETALRQHALQLAARAVESRFNADLSDACGATARCLCGQTARYAGRRRKRFVTALGELTLERAYYHCSCCQSGFSPRDQTLGLAATSLSPAVTRMVATVGAMVSFQEGSELLRELAGVEIAPKQVERTAEALGAEIAAQERVVVELPQRATPSASTLYLGLDGTGVPLRPSELAGHSGKQPDGSAKTREVKLCCVWSAEGRDDKGLPQRDPGSVTYSAAIESAALRDTEPGPSPFANRVQRETRRRNFQRASRRVVLGDGALWIWNLADEHFPGAVQIVDRFHAKQHLSEAGKAIWGSDSQLGKTWGQERHAELDAGQLDAVLQALAVHASTCETARKDYEYFQRNRQRMRYPDFHARGLCTSSGVLEAGCKTAIGARLKRSGMHWTTRGANAIIALRCAKLSGRLDDFWERRAQPPAA
ncbi:MAG TPA: ISKra4 family transposase [Thermoanaerobaculia bacterium]|nr:ISKra4 family transposase [Thermoanaerobaculia bacterium]